MAVSEAVIAYVAGNRSPQTAFGVSVERRGDVLKCFCVNFCKTRRLSDGRTFVLPADFVLKRYKDDKTFFHAWQKRLGGGEAHAKGCEYMPWPVKAKT